MISSPKNINDKICNLHIAYVKVFFTILSETNLQQEIEARYMYIPIAGRLLADNNL